MKAAPRFRCSTHRIFATPQQIREKDLAACAAEILATHNLMVCAAGASEARQIAANRC